MGLLLNVIILFMLIALGFHKFTKDSPEKRKRLLDFLVNAPKSFYKNCKIVVEKVKNKEL